MKSQLISLSCFLSIFMLPTQAISPLDKLENNLMSTHGRIFKEKVLTEYMRNDEMQSWYRVITQLHTFVADRTHKFDEELATISKINAHLILNLITNYAINIAPTLPKAKQLTGTKKLDDLNWKKLKITNIVFQLRETLKQRLVLNDLREQIRASKHFWDSQATRDARNALLFFIEILDAVIARINNEIKQMQSYKSTLQNISH